MRWRLLSLYQSLIYGGELEAIRWWNFNPNSWAPSSIASEFSAWLFPLPQLTKLGRNFQHNKIPRYGWNLRTHDGAVEGMVGCGNLCRTRNSKVRYDFNSPNSDIESVHLVILPVLSVPRRADAMIPSTVMSSEQLVDGCATRASETLPFWPIGYGRIGLGGN